MSSNNSIIVQIRRGTTAQTATFTGALAELTVDTEQKTLVIHDGINPGGNYLSTKNFTQQVYDFANTISSGSAIDNVARSLAQTSFNTANGANGLAQGAYNQANTNSGAIAIIQGVNNTQNTRLDSIETVNLDQNTTITIIQSVNETQNTRLNSIETVNTNQNTSISIIEGVNSWQNTEITAVNGYAVSAFNKANTGGTFTGNVIVQQNLTVDKDLVVTGNLIVSGNSTSVGANTLVIDDPMIVLANNNTLDVVDIGFIAHYGEISLGENYHTGVVRHAETNEYYIFYNYDKHIHATNNVIDITDSSFLLSNVNANYYKGNLIATTAVIGGTDIGGYISSVQGINDTQNTRINSVETINTDQNTAISIIQGVDATQNNNITAVNNYAGSAYDTANGANGLAVGAYNQANTGTSIAQAAFAFANTLSGGSSTDNVARILAQNAYDSSNAVNQFAASAYDTANGANGLTVSAFNKANTNADAITIIQGVNLGQNTTITQVNQFAANAYDTANGANGLAVSAFNRANTNADAITIIQGVDLTQNNNIIAINNYAASAYAQANTNATNIIAVNGFAASSYNQANTATTTAEGANGLAQSAYNQANTAATTATQVNNYAASAYATANSANGLAQAAFDKANTGGTFTGSVVINQDLSVSGNVNITGNVISHGADDLIINDPLIYLANNNTGNLVDIGLVGSFDDGTYQHTGIVRDATDGVWKLFSNVVAEPTTTVDFTYATWDNLRVGTLTGNVAANSITVNGVSVTGAQDKLVNGTREITLFANGIIRLPEHSAFYNNTTNLIANTADQVLDSFDATVYRTAKYLIQGLDGSDVHSTEVMLTHNGTNVYVTEYGTVGSDITLYTVSASLAAGVINLTVSPVNPNTTFDFVRTSIIARELGLNIQGDLMSQSGSEDLNVGDGSEDLNA